MCITEPCVVVEGRGSTKAEQWHFLIFNLLFYNFKLYGKIALRTDENRRQVSSWILVVGRLELFDILQLEKYF